MCHVIKDAIKCVAQANWQLYQSLYLFFHNFVFDHFSEILPLDSSVIRAIPSFSVFFDGLSAVLPYPALFWGLQNSLEHARSRTERLHACLNGLNTYLRVIVPVNVKRKRVIHFIRSSLIFFRLSGLRKNNLFFWLRFFKYSLVVNSWMIGYGRFFARH